MFLIAHLSVKDVLHSVSFSVSVPMCALAGLMMPSQPLVVELSYERKHNKLERARRRRT